MSESFKPMLAAKAKPAKGETDFALIFNKFVDQFRYPMMVSAKLDGIRMIVKDGVVTSRSLKIFPNIQLGNLYNYPSYNGFDGELLIGSPTAPDVYNATQSVVMSHHGSLQDLTYAVFDDVSNPEAPFDERLESARRRVALYQSHQQLPKCSVDRLYDVHDGIFRFKLVPHRLVHSKEELLAFEAECLELGYEGIMGRDPKGTYKFGRSTIKEQGLVALKRFVDDEWVIVDFVPLYKNENAAETNELGRTKRSSAAAGKVEQDTLGAFVVETRDGIRFNVGGGTLMTAVNRKKLWDMRDQLVGRLLKGRYFAIGTKDAPRQPRAVGLRDVLDL